MNREEKEKNIKFDIQLNEEQKLAKEQILKHPFSFIHGKAGSGKCLGYDSEITVMVSEEFLHFLLKRKSMNDYNK